MFRRDIWIGVFVVVSMALLVSFIVYKRQDRPPTYTIYLEFEELAGIIEGAEVRLRGFPIGRVEVITFSPLPADGEPYFLITLAIETQYPIFEGSYAEVKSAGFIGAGYVYINVSKARPVPVEPGARLKGETSSDITRAIARLPEMFDKITYMVRRIGEVRWKPVLHGIGDNVKKIRDHIQRLQQNLSGTLARTDSVLTDTRDLVGAMGDNLDQNLKTSNALLGDVRESVQANSQKLVETLETINTSLTGISGFVNNLDTLTMSSSEDITQILRNLNAATTSLADLLKHPLKAVTGGIK